jgi:hypothetical protein
MNLANLDTKTINYNAYVLQHKVNISCLLSSALMFLSKETNKYRNVIQENEIYSATLYLVTYNHGTYILSHKCKNVMINTNKKLKAIKSNYLQISV